MILDLLLFRTFHQEDLIFFVHYLGFVVAGVGMAVIIAAFDFALDLRESKMTADKYIDSQSRGIRSVREGLRPWEEDQVTRWKRRLGE